MTDAFVDPAVPEHDIAKEYDLARLNEIEQECRTCARSLKPQNPHLIFTVPPSPTQAPILPHENRSLSSYQWNSGPYRLESQHPGNSMVLAHEKQLCLFMLEVALKRRFASELDDVLQRALLHTEKCLESEFSRIVTMKKAEWTRQASLHRCAREAYMQGATVVQTGTAV
jgi:hypothetical protein